MSPNNIQNVIVIQQCMQATAFQTTILRLLTFTTAQTSRQVSIRKRFSLHQQDYDKQWQIIKHESFLCL